MRRRRRRRGRQRQRSRLAVMAATVVAIAVGASISSCRPNGRRTVRPAPPAPLPTSPGVIRVRLIDPTETVTLSATGAYRLTVDGRRAFGGPAGLQPTEVRRHGAGWIFHASGARGKELRLEPIGASSLVGCNGRLYRGTLIIRGVSTDSSRLTVANHVPLEHYLAGVLSRELLGGWHEETYKALAVAARTYAMYEITHNGRRRDFDVFADQRSQVYGGVNDETAKSLAAVRATWGLMMTVGPPGAERVFKTYYSSTCGGITVDAQGLEHQTDVVRPLAGGVICNDCAFSRRYRWDPVRIAKADVFAALACTYDNIAAMGPLKAVRVSTATAWGRPQWLDIVPVHGKPLRVRADDLRLALLRHGPKAAKGIYSMNCTIRDAGDAYIFENGKGFGHAVGLCQYGAEGKARRGLRYHEILYIYYPGSKITRAY